MMNFSFPAIRYASDMPFAAGMVLADEHGSTVEVRAVGTRLLLLSASSDLDWAGPSGSYSHAFCRLWYPYLVFVTEMVADAEQREVERVEALAEAAQHEDDLRQAILDRAEEEWQRKNYNSKFIDREWREVE